MNVSKSVSRHGRLRGLWAAAALVWALALAAALGAPFAVAEAAEPGAAEPGVVLTEDGSECEAGTVLVLFGDGVPAQVSAAAEIAADWRTGSMEVVRGLAKVGLAGGVDIEDACAVFGRVGGVEVAQPNYVYRHAADEAGSGSLTASGAADLLPASSGGDPIRVVQAHLDSIGASDAWSLVDAKGVADRSVTVAVLDEGSSLDHDDLQDGAICAFYDVVQENGDDAALFPVGDHGAHVAGIIGATEGNGEGVAGVGHNKVAIAAVNIFKDGKSNTWYERLGLNWVVEHAEELNIRVINMSYGTLQEDDSLTDPIVTRAISQAAAKGVLAVSAAGNDGTDSGSYPSDYIDGVGVINLAKGSEPYYTQKFSDSNYNAEGLRTKQLSAPGEKIWSTVPDSRYDIKSGTSMAAPIVSGTAALVAAVDPTIGAAEMRDLLASTATDLYEPGFDALSGYGRVNMADAVAAAFDGKRGIATADLSVSETATFAPGGALPEVSVSLHGAELGRDVDYAVRLSGNGELGTATVTVEGIGRYVGTLDAQFQVVPCEVAAPKAAEGLVFTGGELVGVPEGEGYRLSGNRASAAGDYVAVATLASGYVWEGGSGGPRKIAWSIAEAANPVRVSLSTPAKLLVYGESARQVFSPGADFDVSGAKGAVSYQKLAGSEGLTVDERTGAVTAAPGLPVGLHYLRVRVCAEGAEGAYGPGSDLADFYALVVGEELYALVSPETA